jgi:methylglutaconyl-CoA hydratase
VTDALQRARDARGVVTLTMNRPEVRNAFGPDLMAALSDAFAELGEDDTVRVVVLTGDGPAFSAGADLNWMRSMVDYTYDEQVADSHLLDGLFAAIQTFPAPVVARVNGHALGGATGLIACADVAVAARGAKFGFTEARLGLAPAVISTYVLPKIGLSHARRYFLSGQVFDADAAAAIGLVHEVCDPDDLDDRTGEVVADLLAAGPNAQRAIKALIPQVAAAETRQDAIAITVPTIARLRVSDEGQAGMQAFFDKRPAPWVPQD